MISRSTKSRTRAMTSRCSVVSPSMVVAISGSSGGRRGLSRLEAGRPSPQVELRRHLPRRLVDHLVAEHHRSLALHLGGVAVGIEDGRGALELVLAGGEGGVAGVDL